MFDVFTEEIEVLLKDGIANLYWFKRDLHKAWLKNKGTSYLMIAIQCIGKTGDFGIITLIFNHFLRENMGTACIFSTIIISRK